MRGGTGGRWLQVMAVIILLWLHYVIVTSVRKENRCMRHYYVDTIRHPDKGCDSKIVLLARCEGYCSKSRTSPRVSFSPVLHRPFRTQCTCCTPALSVMKAVSLSCHGDRLVFATYRYIVRCSCHYCGGGLR